MHAPPRFGSPRTRGLRPWRVIIVVFVLLTICLEMSIYLAGKAVVAVVRRMRILAHPGWVFTRAVVERVENNAHPDQLDSYVIRYPIDDGTWRRKEIRTHRLPRVGFEAPLRFDPANPQRIVGWCVPSPTPRKALAIAVLSGVLAALAFWLHLR